MHRPIKSHTHHLRQAARIVAVRPTLASRTILPASSTMQTLVSLTDTSRQLGSPKLGGTKPSDLPVQRPNKYELVINLKTAKALGIKISDNVLSLAEEVIE
jgi:hypothetical protein